MSNQYKNTIEDITQGLDNLEDTLIYRYEKQVLKTKEIKNRLFCKYEKLKAVEIEGTKKELLNNISDFFIRKAQIKNNRFFYVVKVYLNEDNIIKLEAAYFGLQSSSFSIISTDKESNEEVSITQITSKKDMLNYIQDNEAVNTYAINIIYKESKSYKMESLYSVEISLDLYVCKKNDNASDEKNILKKFKETDYAPSINFLTSKS